jgi:putative transposase
MSARRACRLAGLWRSSWQYRSRRREPEGLRERIKELAAERPRFGYPRLHVLLRREGRLYNRKRIYRIYRDEKLQLRRKRRKRVASAPRRAIPLPDRPHVRWSMDFMSDSLRTGQRVRALNIVDDCTRVCTAVTVDTSIPGVRVARTLDEATTIYGTPSCIVVDNGPEFISRALDEWAYAHGVELHFIDPGKPNQNAFVESFNGKMRDECMNQHAFDDLGDARRKIEAWRQDYNTCRPHESLGWRTPEEYAASLASGSALRASPPATLVTSSNTNF